jgi:hypothetical protein
MLDEGGQMFVEGGSTKDYDDKAKEYINQVEDCGNQDLGKDQMNGKCGLTRETIQSKAFAV